MEEQIKDMQQLIDQQLPGIGNVLWTLLLGLLIGLAYRMLKRLLLPSLAQTTTGQRWARRLDLVERLFWPVLGMAVLMSLLISRPLVGLVVSAVVVLTLFKPLRNYVFGLIYRGGRTYSIGQRIQLGNHRGSIRAFGNLSLEMELEDGSRLDIPYSTFADSNVKRSSPKSGVLSHSIELRITKPCEIEQIKKSIRSQLLAMPYVLPDQKITMEHLADEADFYLLKINLKGIDNEQMSRVEGRLREKFQ